jgi:hypothetical protein
MMGKLNYSGVLLLLVVLAACSNLGIGNTACAPPCWQNLTPGISTEAEVERFVKRLPPSEQETLRLNTFTPGRRLYGWIDADKKGGKGIDVVDGRVALIELRPPEFDLRLGTVVERFGPPEFLFARIGCLGHGGCYRLELLYPQQGLAFESWPDMGNADKISPDMLVSAAFYFEPGSLEDYWIKGKGAPPENWAFDRRYIQPWPGFGPIVVPTEVPVGG